MKKIIAMVFCICMMLTLSVSVFAADSEVMSVTYSTAEGSFEDKYTVFHKGWTEAIKKSVDRAYENVTVTLLTDWLSDDDGQFTPDFFNDDGFNWDAIDFPEKCIITVDLNGFKIDRKLEEWEYNGEVMCINEGATVTIKNGTISGGFSGNGAGGIHMKGGDVTLENVDIMNNNVEDDFGAGITVLGGNLVMNNGSIKNNTGFYFTKETDGAGAYLENCKATFNNVDISNNVINGPWSACIGGGIYSKSSELELINCFMSKNISPGSGGALFISGGKVNVTDCVITDNFSGRYGGGIYIGGGGTNTISGTHMYENKCEYWGEEIYCVSSKTVIKNCKIDGHVMDVYENSIEWINDSPSNLFGSIISGGNVFVIAGVAVIVVIAAVVIVKKRKNNKKEE